MSLREIHGEAYPIPLRIPTAAEREDWEDILQDLHPRVRDTMRRYPPWASVRMRSTGEYVRLVSLDEQPDGEFTLTVVVLCRLHKAPLHRVFGIPLGDIETIQMIQ